MSSITSSMGDLQSQISQIYNQINKATIEAGQKFTGPEINEQNFSQSQEFAKALEEQFQKQTQQVLNNEVNFLQDNQLGMPAGFNITEVGEPETNFNSMLGTLMDSMMENLDKNNDGKVSTDEIQRLEDAMTRTESTETTGSLAFLNNGTTLKNHAGNFIQKLINAYKDNGNSIIGLNV